MTIYEHWLSQKEKLPPVLQQTDLSGLIYQVRHAILQTEQNALAEMQDDILRQQAGVLFGCIKNSVGFVDANIAVQTWLPQKDPPKSARKLPLIFLTLLLLLAICCALSSQWFLFLLTIAASASGIGTFFVSKHVHRADVADEFRITLNPDTDKLCAVLDGQFRALDRYLNDFVYLNEQLRGSSDCTDPAAVSRAADLMEALYERDESERTAVDEAAKKMLESLGLRALDYSDESSRFFNALPSKQVTRTLAPAIFSIKDQRLLRRGTAAVKIDAA